MTQSNDQTDKIVSEEEARDIYFSYRGFGFRLSFWFIVASALFFGLFETLAPKTFAIYVLTHTAEEAESLRLYVTIRGVIILMMLGTWLVTFRYRLALARYVIYFATCFVATNFARDLYQLSIAESFEAMLASSFVLALRPVFLMALVQLSFGFTATIPFEKGRAARHESKGLKKVSG